MKHFGRRELVALNGVLAAVLVALFLWPAARGLWGGSAAFAQQARPRGQYLIVSGDINGPPSHAIYIMDTINLEMVAIRWETGRKDFVGLGYRNIDEDAKIGGGGR
jgi:hypothetical protein